MTAARSGSSAMKHIVVGTAGHIDHGKTELVKSLTGVNPDRLREEQERGITIDLGFAPLALDDDLTVGFIDVPGHERFVKNMLAGVWGIDIVLLVVAADESIKPQTREHFDICSLLRVKRGLVALTKIDLTGDEMTQLVSLEIRDFLKGSFLQDAPIVPLSARTGEGLAALRLALAAAARQVEPGHAGRLLRLPVDRSFSARGFGTVVTGTLVSGRLAEGEEVAVLPAGTTCRVRGLQVHGKAVGEALAGRRTAVNLQGIDAAGVQRGDVLSRPGEIRATSLLDVSISLLPGAPGRIKDMDRVRYHQGTSELLARVKLLGPVALAPGETGCAQLRLERPACSLPGDRFVLRRYSPAATIGGGVVRDVMPVKHRGRVRAERMALLDRLAAATRAEAMELFALEAPMGAPLASLAPRLGLTRDEAEGCADEVLARGAVLKAGAGSGTVLIGRTIVEQAEGAIRDVLAVYHRAHPLRAGMPLEELRARALGGLDMEATRLVLQRLAGGGDVAIEKDLARLAAHRVTLSGDEERQRRLLEQAYRAGGLNPPAPGDAARTAGLDAKGAETLTRLLLSDGTLVKIRDGMVFHAAILEELKSRLWAMRPTRRVIDIGAFKELTGTSRKNAIPLLEHLDAVHVTRRVGSDREILPPAGG